MIWPWSKFRKLDDLAWAERSKRKEDAAWWESRCQKASKEVKELVRRNGVLRLELGDEKKKLAFAIDALKRVERGIHGIIEDVLAEPKREGSATEEGP